MRAIESYAEWLYDKIAANKKIKLSHIKRFDKYFDEEQAWNKYFFKGLMARLINHYGLDTLDRELRFLSLHFELDFIMKLRQYYVTDINASNNIRTLDDLKKIDVVTELGFYDYFTDKNVYNQIIRQYDRIFDKDKSVYFDDKSVYNDDIGESFQLQLRILDTIFPEENHIPNFLVFVIENYKKPFARLDIEPKEHLKYFVSHFDLQKLAKDNILKDYLRKKGHLGCLGYMDECGML